MYYPKTSTWRSKELISTHNFTIALPLHYAANDTQHFFHYLKNVKQLKWNFDKMSMYDSEKNTYEIYLFF